MSWINPVEVQQGSYWCPACKRAVQAEDVRREWSHWFHLVDDGEHEVYPAMVLS